MKCKRPLIATGAFILLLSLALVSAEPLVDNVKPQLQFSYKEKVIMKDITLVNLDTGNPTGVNWNTENGMDYSITTTQPLDNGVHKVTLFSADLVGNEAKHDFRFTVFVNESDIKLMQPRIGVSNRTMFDVLVTTSRPSTCKYSGIPISSFTEGVLKQFDPGDKVNHWLRNFTLAADTNRPFFVICRDDLGRVKTRQYTLYSDLTKPRFESITFDPEKIVEYQPNRNDLGATLHVVASEDVICKYKKDEPANYTYMTPFPGFTKYVFNAFKSRNKVNLSVAQNLSRNIFTYYIECEDRAGWRTGSQQKGIRVEPEGLQFRVNTPQPFVNSRSLTLNITTNKRAYCEYRKASASEFIYISGDTLNLSDLSTYSTEHIKSLPILAEGNNTLRIKCTTYVTGEPEISEKDYTFVIDMTAPSTTTINATPYVCNDQVSATFSSDDPSGISEYMYWFTKGDRDEIITNGTTTGAATITTNNDGIPINFTKDATYSIVVLATDRAGNTQARVSRLQGIAYEDPAVHCDTTPPTVVVTDTPFGQKVLNCTDDTSGCFSYKYSVQQGNCSTENAFTYYFTYTSAVFDPAIPVSSASIPIGLSGTLCYEVTDGALPDANVIRGSITVGNNVTVPEITEPDCTNGIDNDGDKHGERCPAGPDCDDTDGTIFFNCPTGCTQDLDGDGYGLGCILGNDCDGRDANLTTSCPNGCISDNDGDEYGLGCSAGQDCNGDDSTKTTDCPDTGCTDDNDGDGFGLTCKKGLDCNGENAGKQKNCDNGCFSDIDGDEYGLGCSKGFDCAGKTPDVHDGCENSCIQDEDEDGVGLGCADGPDCDGFNALRTNDCANNCTNDEDGEAYGWGCSSPDCNGIDPGLALACPVTLCVEDADGDGYGLGCDVGPDCDDNHPFVNASCTDNCTHDQDCDRLPDDWETNNGLNPADASDSETDPDGDGATNLQEYRALTDPQTSDEPAEIVDDTDRDKDGCPNDYEDRNGLDPDNPDDLIGDDDDDGLSNGDECSRGTRANNPDTDGDSYDDGVEVDAGTDPLDPDDHPGTIIGIIMIIMGILIIILATAFLVYKNYYLPMRQPKPSGPRMPPPGTGSPPSTHPVRRPMPHRSLPGQPQRPTPGQPQQPMPHRPAPGERLSHERFAKMQEKKGAQRSKLFDVFGPSKPKETSEKKPSAADEIMRKLAGRPEPKVERTSAEAEKAALHKFAEAEHRKPVPPSTPMPPVSEKPAQPVSERPAVPKTKIEPQQVPHPVRAATKPQPIAHPAPKETAPVTERLPDKTLKKFAEQQIPSKTVEKLGEQITDDSFDKLTKLTPEEMDEFSKLSSVITEKSLGDLSKDKDDAHLEPQKLEPDQVEALASITKDIHDDTQKKKEFHKAVAASDMDKLDTLLSDKHDIDEFLGSTDKKDAVEDLDKIAKKKKR